MYSNSICSYTAYFSSSCDCVLQSYTRTVKSKFYVVQNLCHPSEHVIFKAKHHTDIHLHLCMNIQNQWTILYISVLQLLSRYTNSEHTDSCRLVFKRDHRIAGLVHADWGFSFTSVNSEAEQRPVEAESSGPVESHSSRGVVHCKLKTTCNHFWFWRREVIGELWMRRPRILASECSYYPLGVIIRIIIMIVLKKDVKLLMYLQLHRQIHVDTLGCSKKLVQILRAL